MAANNKSRNNIAKVSERAEPIQPNLYHTFTGFGATVCCIVYCGQTVGWIEMPLARETQFYGDPAPPQKRGHSSPLPLFGQVYCGQTSGKIKMPPGTQGGLSPGSIVLDGDLAQNRHSCPIFGPYLL